MDSFWLVDVPFYAVAVLLAGVKPQLLHLVPTIVGSGSSASEPRSHAPVVGPGQACSPRALSS